MNEIRKGSSIFNWTAVVIIGASIVWLLFGDDLIPARILFKRFGFNMPAGASDIVVNNEEDVMVIAFQLLPADSKAFVKHPLPGYNGWRRQGKNELLPSLGGIPGPQSNSFIINEKRIGRRLWRILVNSETGECFAYYERDSTPGTEGNEGQGGAW